MTDRHGVEIPAEYITGTHPNPDPHEEDTAVWCPTCGGEGSVGSGANLQKCATCDGFAILGGAPKKREPISGPQLELDRIIIASNQCLTMLSQLQRRIEGISAAVEKIRRAR